ncbi:MAG: hypothetical protein IJX81_05290 [Clostridia bacterium]|nr:hypothetical protein [Clostridia bacterium]
MKKILTIFMTLVLSVCCFTACGGDNPLLNGGKGTGGSSSASTGSSSVPAQTFTITYVCTEGEMTGELTQEVTLGESYSLNALTRDGYTGYWAYNGQKIESTGVWTIEEDVTLTAEWKRVSDDDNDGWTGIY